MSAAIWASELCVSLVRQTGAVGSYTDAHLLGIQSNLFKDPFSFVVIPLVAVSAISDRNLAFNSEFHFEAAGFELFPLAISFMYESIPKERNLSLNPDSDSVIAALDLLLARFRM